MDEETKVTSDNTITLSLPGPAIQRSVTLEQVRAYLRAQGWEHTGATEDKSGEMWERLPGARGGRARHRLWTSPHVTALGSIAAVVLNLAAEAGITPGEMLARIADGPAATTPPTAGAMTHSLLLLAADLLDYGAEAVRGGYNLPAALTKEERATFALLATRNVFNDSPPEHWPASGVISAESTRVSAAIAMGALARIADGPAAEPAEPKWITLAELRDGAIFETRAGVRAVKSEYRYPYGGIECVLLASGEAAHFAQGATYEEQAQKHNATEVREIDAAAAERARVADLAALVAILTSLGWPLHTGGSR